MTDGNKSRIGLEDQSETQGESGNFSNDPQETSEKGQKGGQATQQENENRKEDTDMSESYTGDQ